MKLKTLAFSLFASLGIITALMLGFVALAQPAVAACDSTLSLQSGINCGTPGSASQKGLFGIDPAHPGNLFQTIADTLILVIGAISVIMVIIGGLRYVLSTGNPSATAGAKDQILYAIIGVVVAILAYAIVNFVIGQIK